MASRLRRELRLIPTIELPTYFARAFVPGALAHHTLTATSGVSSLKRAAAGSRDREAYQDATEFASALALVMDTDIFRSPG